MIRIKNAQRHILMIADAGLRLGPGEEVWAPKITPQLQDCVTKGFVVQVEDPPAKTPELSILNAPDAIEVIREETRIDVLTGYQETEHRKTVLAAIKDRLEDLGHGDG